MAKCRVGFVANSSSSSFLIFGVIKEVYDEDNPRMVEVEEEDWEVVNIFRQESGLDAIQIGEGETRCYVGKTIFNNSGGSMSIDAIVEGVATAKEFLKEKGIEDAKAYFGISYC